MQTVYFTTSNYIRHEGNMVDLNEYRRKLAIAQGEPEPKRAEEQPAQPRPRAARRRRAALPGMVLDYAASVALIITALSFAAKIL